MNVKNIASLSSNMFVHNAVAHGLIAQLQGSDYWNVICHAAIRADSLTLSAACVALVNAAHDSAGD